MILILSDRQDSAVRRVLPEIVPVAWWDGGESAAGSRATAVAEGERVVADPDGARAPVEESAGPPAGDAIAAWPAA
ncbi:hypothetical protein [Microbispora hainanensis]|uniref:Uncharacterized protein n=1 Tax=Microbispora hainanensis TaxID=568844 RepID=A0A544YNF6_9ACTN|nr:hypothetical protein [Microbispora hainanensis]TQS18257.1 hypothetical protein FLX08_25125 [Microbispora hainanensis]